MGIYRRIVRKGPPMPLRGHFGSESPEVTTTKTSPEDPKPALKSKRRKPKLK